MLRAQRLHQRIDNARTDYMNKVIAEIVKTKPSYITIELSTSQYGYGYTCPYFE
jgi:hypothetical protein